MQSPRSKGCPVIGSEALGSLWLAGGRSGGASEVVESGDTAQGNRDPASLQLAFAENLSGLDLRERLDPTFLRRVTTPTRDP